MGSRQGPRFRFDSYLMQKGKRQTGLGSYLIRFVLYRTKKGSYLFSFHAYLIEIGSYLIQFVAYLFALGSYLFSSDKEQTKKGKIQNEKGRPRNCVPEASDGNRKTGKQIPDVKNEIPEIGNQKGKTGNLVSGLPFFVPSASDENPKTRNQSPRGRNEIPLSSDTRLARRRFTTPANRGRAASVRSRTALGTRRGEAARPHWSR